MWYFIVITVLLLLGEQSSAYKAAVVDYHPDTAETPMATINQNLYNYGTHVQEAKNQNVDIIVFPEYGLTTMVEHPEKYAIVIENENVVVKNLSTLARENQIYVAVNLLEKFSNGTTTKYYNTNLIFNRNGDIIATYRKINLFGEPNLTPGDPTQRVTFATDFGITFATFTCFDILYRNPSRTILDENIFDVVYPTSWFSTVPFYASLSVQHGYAASTGVNLLASNLNDPENTHGGSGIYLSDGTSKIYLSDVPETKVLVKRVLKRTIKKNKKICRTTRPLKTSYPLPETNLSNYKTLRDFKASDYTFKELDLNQKDIDVNICYNNFCCNFNVTILEHGSADIYKVMAYNGIVPYDQGTAHVTICSLLACGNTSNDSCGTRIRTTTKFSNILVRGNFKKNSTSFYTPLSLNYYLQPLQETNFCELDNENSISMQLTSTYHKYEDVLVYGLFSKTE